MEKRCKNDLVEMLCWCVGKGCAPVHCVGAVRTKEKAEAEAGQQPGASTPCRWCIRTRGSRMGSIWILSESALGGWCIRTPRVCDYFSGDVASSQPSLCFEDLDYIYPSCCFSEGRESICVFKHLFLGFARVIECLREHSCKLNACISSNYLHINP